MLVAFTSSDGKVVDRHFGNSEAFYLWDVSPDAAHALGRVDAPTGGEEAEDKVRRRVDLLGGCTLVYTARIGGPAAARLVGKHIHPVKLEASTAIDVTIERLRTVLQGQPPPWLRKVLGIAPKDLTIHDEDQ